VAHPRRRDGHVSGLNELKAMTSKGSRPMLAIDQLRARRKVSM
jgi:hypothetical protein